MTDAIITATPEDSTITLTLTKEQAASLESALLHAVVMSDYLSDTRNKIQKNLDLGVYIHEFAAYSTQADVNSLTRMIDNFESNAELIKFIFEKI